MNDLVLETLLSALVLWGRGVLQTDPACDLNYTFNAPQERDVKVALSNAFGFGGHNTCIVFKKVEDAA